MAKQETRKKYTVGKKSYPVSIFGIAYCRSLYKYKIELILFLPATLLFGNFFCGWACPFGTLQELMGTIGKKFFKKRYKMPRSIQKYMQYSRYILFGILIIGVLNVVLMPLNGYLTFMQLFSKDMRTAASVVALSIMIVYLLLALIFERPFCNYLCTEAAKYGVLSMTRIFSIKRNESTCINCKKCDKACPMNIQVSAHNHVRNGQCINCLKCIHDCPVEGTLSYSRVKLPIGKNKKK